MDERAAKLRAALIELTDLIESAHAIHADIATAWREFVATSGAPPWLIEPPIVRDRGYTRLGPRQLEVLELIAMDYSDKEISQCLGLSSSTVKTHIHRILQKMSVRNRREAARKGIAQGLIPHRDC